MARKIVIKPNKKLGGYILVFPQESVDSFKSLSNTDKNWLLVALTENIRRVIYG